MKTKRKHRRKVNTKLKDHYDSDEELTKDTERIIRNILDILK